MYRMVVVEEQVSAAVAHWAPGMPNQSSFASALFLLVYYDQLARQTKCSHDRDQLQYYTPSRRANYPAADSCDFTSLTQAMRHRFALNWRSHKLALDVSDLSRRYTRGTDTLRQRS